jgi:hypothetical protein
VDDPLFAGFLQAFGDLRGDLDGFFRRERALGDPLS